MTDLVHLSPATAGVTALLGYAVVFFALVLLMAVVLAMGALMRRKQAPPAAQESASAPAPEKSLPLAPGSAGEVKLYDTDPRTAAMLMAIVADELKTPLNELRFVSIREVKE